MLTYFHLKPYEKKSHLRYWYIIFTSLGINHSKPESRLLTMICGMVNIIPHNFMWPFELQRVIIEAFIK